VVWTATVGNFEIFYKRNPTGNAIGITNIGSEFPVNYILYQNYPNPFNPSTTINYDLPITSYVKLVIYNILGKEIEVLVNQQLQPGRYEVEWSATGGVSSYPSGVYFYKLITNDFSETKKMVFIK
jgi:hypothetical protein